jgi:imidazoleglycerol-phosphate dehydratase
MTRIGQFSRSTAETEISVWLDLDGTGAASITTGVGFYDHLLTSFAHHSLIDLKVETKGDLEVDDHHTVEDTAMVIGKALADALGDRAGICRFGNASIPMDEALARAAVDAGGRPYALVNLPFKDERIGGLSTPLITHVIETLASAAGFTIHIQATGRDDHHMAEATFKALARAVQAAVAVDPRRCGIPSTKGTA